MIEAGWTCPSTHGPPDQSTCSPICGDGIVVFSEACDDGLLDGKGCLNNCTGEINGYYCSGGTPTTPSVCTSHCGDGWIVDTE